MQRINIPGRRCDSERLSKVDNSRSSGVQKDRFAPNRTLVPAPRPRGMRFLRVSIKSGTGTGPNRRTKVEGQTASRAALAWIAPAPQSLSQARKRDRVPLATVLPGSSDLKTGVFEKASNALVRELVTVLGVNRFASLEVKIKLRVLDTYILLLRTLEVHLDPRLRGIPKRAMAEATGVKGGPQFPIQSMKDIQIERSGDSFAVIIGGQQRGFVFHHIRTQQERISDLQLRTQSSQDHPRFFR